MTYIESVNSFMHKYSGDFKGINRMQISRGIIELQNGMEIPYFIETGKPSMVMIYGIQTLMQIVSKGEEWILKTERRYKNRGLFDHEE